MDLVCFALAQALNDGRMRETRDDAGPRVTALSLNSERLEDLQDSPLYQGSPTPPGPESIKCLWPAKDPAAW